MSWTAVIGEVGAKLGGLAVSFESHIVQMTAPPCEEGQIYNTTLGACVTPTPQTSREIWIWVLGTPLGVALVAWLYQGGLLMLVGKLADWFDKD